MKLFANCFFCFFVVITLAGCATNSSKTDLTLKQAKMNYDQEQYKDAFTNAKKAAITGNPEAEYALGYMYYYGKGTPLNKTLGEKWVLKASEAGNKTAQEAYRLILLRQQQVIPTSHSDRKPSANNLSKRNISDAIKKAPIKKNKYLSPNLGKSSTPNNLKDIQYKSKTNKKKHYTIQIFATGRKSHAASIIQKYKLGKKAYCSQRTLKEKDIYIVNYGKYSSQKSAFIALNKLPLFIRKLKPFVRLTQDIKDIQVVTKESVSS